MNINTVLSDEEMKEISDDPIKSSIDTFWKIHKAVGFLYLILCIILYLFSYSELKSYIPTSAKQNIQYVVHQN